MTGGVTNAKVQKVPSGVKEWGRRELRGHHVMDPFQWRRQGGGLSPPIIGQAALGPPCPVAAKGGQGAVLHSPGAPRGGAEKAEKKKLRFKRNSIKH